MENWKFNVQHYFGMCPVTAAPLSIRQVMLVGTFEIKFDYANRVIDAGPLACHCHGKKVMISAFWTDAQIEDALAVPEGAIND